jgi:hypothetical protein
VYVTALAAAGVRAREHAGGAEEAALVPVVLAVMHLAHGAGTLRGALRYGPPLAAIAAVLGLSGLARRLWPPDEPVYAPSLSL